MQGLEQLSQRSEGVMRDKIGCLIYRLCELLDGEKGLKILDYKVAEVIKVFCLRNLIVA